MTYRTIDLGELVRLHAIRAPRLMWFLGAGISAGAGIPTAGQLIDEFKQLIYCSETGVARRLVDLSEPATTQKVQAYLDADSRFPPAGSAAEYSTYFEIAMRGAKDRRAFLQARVTGKQPTYGHLVLAVLMAMHRCRLIWTTNFDPLLEDAVAKVLESTSILTTVEPETAARIAALTEERWPIQVKLHGDFRSELLKNTESELQQQDARLRKGLIAECQRGGLVVLGYSGRDDSVMDALSAALESPDPFPDGLYWCHYGAGAPLPRVNELLTTASAAGVDACLVPSGVADEVLSRMLDVSDVSEELQAHLDRRQPERRWSAMRLPPLEGSWPRVGLNALPIETFPHTCRIVECEIGGAREVRAAVEDAGADLIATRRSDGVIGFGADAAFRRCFESFDLKSLDVGQIDVHRLWRERSADLTILYDAITRAMAGDLPLERHRLHGQNVLALSADADVRETASLAKLRQVVGQFSGVHGAGFRWAEAVRIRLEQRLSVLWLVYEPIVWGESVGSRELAATRADFIRERGATRYNKAWAGLLSGWAELLTAGQQRRTIAAFDLREEPGVDASFTVVRQQAHSRRRPRRSR